MTQVKQDTIELKQGLNAEIFTDAIVIRKGRKQIAVIRDFTSLGMGWACSSCDGYDTLTMETLARQISRTQEYKTIIERINK